MYSRIILWQQGAPRVSLKREADGAVSLDLTRDGHTAALALAGFAWFDIPEILLVAVDGSADDGELKVSDEKLRGAYGLLRGRLKDLALKRGVDIRLDSFAWTSVRLLALVLLSSVQLTTTAQPVQTAPRPHRVSYVA